MNHRIPSRLLPAAIGLVFALHSAPGFAVTTEELVPKSLPTTLSGSYLAGRSADAIHDIAAAIDYFDEALSADPENPSLIERILILRTANGDIEQAAALSTRLVAIDKANPLGRLVLAVKALKAESYDQAAAQLAQTGKAPLAVLTAGLLTAWAQEGNGQVDEAIKTITDLDGPGWYGIFKDYHAALISDLAGRKDDAVQAISRAYKTDPSAMRVVEAYGRIVAYAGDTPEALRALNAYTMEAPNHPMMQGLIDTLKAGKPPAPLVKTATAGAAEVLYGLGSAIGTDDGTELPSAYLQLAAYLDPDAFLAVMALGDLLSGADRCDEAVVVYDHIPESSELRRSADIQSGICLDVLNRADEGANRIKRVVDANPADLEAVMALGNVYRAHEKFADAAETYSRGIATIADPAHADWRIYYFRGIAYERNKQWPLAEADLKQALAIKPDQPQVLNYLGYSWVDMGLNLDQALGMIRTAVDLRPNDGYIVDSLGWAYYRLGRYDDAVAQLERAVELRPDDSVINDHLGDALWRDGRRLEATFQWNHARDLNPEPDAREKIVKKLQGGMTVDAGRDG